MLSGSAEIVGAGVAGTTLAAALARRGWAVTLREAAPALRATGGGLYLAADAFAAAADLGIAGRLREASYRPPAFETFINGLPKSREVNSGTYRTALRSDLHSLLVGAARDAGVDVRTGERVVAVTPDGAVALADGSGARADLVVIAEGVASTLPAALGLEPRRVRFAEGIVRVLLDRTVLQDEGWCNSRDFWEGRRRLLRILYTPCSPTHCYLCLMASADAPDTSGLPVRHDVWAETFPDLAPLLERIGADARFDRYGSIRLDRWRAGRVAIIGDAAHAMPSSIGRGANLAMRSALALARAVSGASTPEAGLEAWEAAVRPAVEETQALAEMLVTERARAVVADRPIPRRSALSDLADLVPESLREERPI